MLLILIILIYNISDYVDVICCTKVKHNVGLHGEYNITKDAAESIGKDINTIGKGISAV